MATAKKSPPKFTASAKATSAATLGAPAEGMCQVLQVISKRDGFRRAGRAWHGTTIVPLDELTREQYEQITSEPLLVAQLLEVPVDQVGDLAAADGAAGSETGT